MNNNSSFGELDLTKSSTEPEHNPEQPSALHSFWDILRFIVIALMIVVPIRMFVAQPFIVSGASMQETFQSGDYLIVDQLSYRFHEPKRGDVVIFKYPLDPNKYFVKRVIGLPGETITVEGNVVTVVNNQHPNGTILTEEYINTMINPNHVNTTLGVDEYFVMGDNRDQSSDSRSWGVLDKSFITGRAYLRLFPPQQFDYLPGNTAPENIIIQNP